MIPEAQSDNPSVLFLGANNKPHTIVGIVIIVLTAKSVLSHFNE